MAEAVEASTGVEDVVRSVRELTRSTRGLGTDIVGVVERELAMAIDISERLRDEVISRETLKRARDMELHGRFKRDAHRAIDLVADTGAVTLLIALDFIERFVDERRPALRPGAKG
jgi:hypothetical protein